MLLANEDQWAQWSNGSADEAMALVMPIAAERLRIVKQIFEKKDGGQ